MPTTQSGGGWFGGNDQSSMVGLPTTTTTSSTTTNYNSSTGVSSGIIQYIYYFFVLICILLLFLLIIHYTITPIFIMKPGGKGIIGIPGSDDSKVFWKESVNPKNPSSLVPVLDTEAGITGLAHGYSFMIDIQVDNPTANTGAPRILASRGGELIDPTKLTTPYTDSDSILKINPKFNICLALDKLTNDLTINVQTTDQRNPSVPYVETITIPNLPVAKSVRIGLMVSNKLVEVYINGYLIESKVLIYPLREQFGPFRPPLDSVSSTTARVRNLRIWRRMLGVSEFRSYGAAISLSLKNLPDSCSV